MPTLSSFEPALQDGLLTFFEEVWRDTQFPFDPLGAHADLLRVPAEYQVDGGGFWLLMDGDQLIGTVALRRLSDNIAEVKRLNVAEAFRGKGFGRRLLHHAVGEATQAGFQAIRLDTIRNRGSAVRLFERYGFNEIPRYNENPDADVFMELNLAPPVPLTHTSAPAMPPRHDRSIRRATPTDADALFLIRRDAIRLIASRGMPKDVAREWADARTAEWIAGILHNRDVWVFETGGVVAGWVSVTNDTIDGLYTSPEHEQRGVGSRLLAFVEATMSRGGVSEARLESSWNAEGFYIRRGYKPDGPRTSDGTLLMRKRLGTVSPL